MLRTSTHDIAPAALERYGRALPRNEHAALAAWASRFYPFQRDWLFDASRSAAGNKSRQIGWSHTTAANADLWSGFHGELTTVISIGDRESAEVLDKCARHARVLQGLGSKMLRMVRSSKHEIVFASGGRVLALPSTAGRSFSGNVILDEFAYQKHAAQVWDNAAAVTALGYKLRVLSTPNGMGNEFHAIWEQALKDAAWSAHMVPLARAIAQGFPVDVDYCFSVIAKGDPRLFEQLFNCSFLDAVLQYFPSPKIDACRVRTPIPDRDDRTTYYAGLDIGREVDLSCLTVVGERMGRVRPVHIETMKRTDSDGLEAMVEWAFEKYDLRRLCLDETGLGTFPADRIKKKHGDAHEVKYRRNRVEPIKFGLQSKEALATGMHALISSGRLELPEGDAHLPSFERRNFFPGTKVEMSDGPRIIVNAGGTALQLRKELAAVQRIVTAAGNVIYDTPRTSEGHGDRAWSLMLAANAVEKKSAMLTALQGGDGN